MTDEALTILVNTPVIVLLAIIVYTLVKSSTVQSSITVGTLKSELDIQRGANRGAMGEQRERLDRLTDSNAELRITVASLQNTITELTADKRTVMTERDEWKANWTLITNQVTALKERIVLLESLMIAGGVAIPPLGESAAQVARDPFVPLPDDPKAPPDA